MDKYTNMQSYLEINNKDNFSIQQVINFNNMDINNSITKKRMENSDMLAFNKEPEEKITGDSHENIEYELGIAIREEQFFLCYQPLIDTKSKKMVWMEALIRWKHPQKGIINPLDFIPIAERTGQIVLIGEWVLENACRQLRKWYDKNYSNYGISVNISAIQLRQPGFSEFVVNVINKNRLVPESLEIEITESELIESSHVVTNNIALLCEQGIKITLDDFGTGYNSFKYIQEFLINGIKIDKIFISNMNVNINKIIIDSVISFGHKINAEVTAEGVETKEQYEYLKSHGCDRIQGYYFSKPLSPEELIEYMACDDVR